MATLTAPKIAELLMENAIETFESQESLIPLVRTVDVDQATMQNSGNAVWRKVQQHAPSIAGFDLTGLETGIIQESYQAQLGTPDNDLVDLRIDDLRDKSYWIERGKVSGRKRASNLNLSIVNIIRNTGSLAYRSNATSGFNFISTAQAAMNKRQIVEGTRYFALNDTHQNLFAADLAARQTLQGRPADTWLKGQIGTNVAGFDIYTSSSISALAGGADPATTVTANVSFAPTGGSVNTATGVVTNVDYRDATIAVTASAAYNIGDRVTFANGGTTVKAVGRDDKTVTDEAMTFTIVAKPSGTSVTIWPKPIANDDPALSTLEKAYSNINTRILNTATMNRVNIDASTLPSIFWEKDSIEVIKGDAPIELMGQFGGMKIAKETMKNGLNMYLLYDSNIIKASSQWRMFVWYGVNNAKPGDNGVAIKF
jgi:hypothetical protein